jgi:hypothetical protein
MGANNTYFYRVYASNVVGDTGTPGFPTMTLDSGFSNIVKVTRRRWWPLAPTQLTARVLSGPRVNLTWQDNSRVESGFVIERSDNGGEYFRLAEVGPRSSTGTVSYTDRTIIHGRSYTYRVAALSSVGMSAYSNMITVISSS